MLMSYLLRVSKKCYMEQLCKHQEKLCAEILMIDQGYMEMAKKNKF